MKNTSHRSDLRLSWGGGIALVGHYDPAALAPIVGGRAGAQLAILHGPSAVPIHHLARGFAQRGIESTVIGGLRNGPTVYVHSTPLSAVLYPKRGGAFFVLDGWHRERQAILQRLEEIKPSMVHAHWTLEAARAVADWDGPKVLTVHDAAYECAKLGWSWNLGAMTFTARGLANTAAILKRFSHIIAVSPFVETYLRIRHHFRGEIRVIPNAIPPLPSTARIPNSFPKTDCLTFGCYGGPGPLKNVKAALDAFTHVHRELPNSRLLVFGAGDWLRTKARYANEPIEFRGALSHVEFLEWLAAEVDIWLHPSRIEAHPIVLCEAIQAGCPVIAGRSSGAVPWTLDYGRAGLLVDIEEPSEIARAMLKLTHDRELAARLVSDGRRMILNRFNPDLIVDRHLKFYEEIIQQWHHRNRI